MMTYLKSQNDNDIQRQSIGIVDRVGDPPPGDRDNYLSTVVDTMHTKVNRH